MQRRRQRGRFAEPGQDRLGRILAQWRVFDRVHPRRYQRHPLPVGVVVQGPAAHPFTGRDDRLGFGVPEAGQGAQEPQQDRPRAGQRADLLQ